MTIQVEEKIYFNDLWHILLSKPLEPYLETANIKSKLLKLGSNCRRKYVGEWAIQNNFLYLVKLNCKVWAEEEELVKSLLPTGDNVVATWYTGNLRVPMGEPIHHYTYEYPLCENEIIFTVEKGIIIDHKIIKNEAPIIDSDFNDSIPF